MKYCGVQPLRCTAVSRNTQRISLNSIISLAVLGVPLSGLPPECTKSLVLLYDLFDLNTQFSPFIL
jgi:hypothetical protein